MMRVLSFKGKGLGSWQVLGEVIFNLQFNNFQSRHNFQFSSRFLVVSSELVNPPENFGVNLI